LNLKFLNELAASNDRNFKFTALERVGGNQVGSDAARDRPASSSSFGAVTRRPQLTINRVRMP
jgi:hypothetical protein